MGFWSLFKRKKETSKTEKINFEVADISDNMGIPELSASSLSNIKEIRKTDTYNAYNEKQAISIFLNWAQNGKILGDNYPVYMKYELNIDNPLEFHKRMIKEGYLCEPTLELILKNLKVAELKQILTNNGQIKTGKKADLIARIINTIPANTLHEIFKNNYSSTRYVLSEKGSKFIKDNYFYIGLHNHQNWCISIYEYEHKKNSFSFKPLFNDVVWGIFNDRNLEYTKKYNWGLVRNNISNMAELLFSENKKDNALLLYITVLYYDLSGLDNNNILLDFDQLFIAPGLIKIILNLKEYYDEKLIETLPFINQLPFSYFSIDTFKIILHDLFSNNEIDLNNYKKYEQTINKKEFGIQEIK